MPTEAATSRPKRLQKPVDRATKKSPATPRTTKGAALLAPDRQTGTHRTKHEHVLALLGRAEGATLIDLMEATGWQQHSVRGFLAGTVKKKLGLTLTSSKDGDLRRYHIIARRGR